MDPTSERRSAARSRVLLSGTISEGDDGVCVACSVVNLSAVGALLVVSDAIALPGHFNVKVRDATYAAQLRWRRGRQVGVKFFVDAAGAPEGLAVQGTRELHLARAENAWLKARETALLKRLAELGYVEADEF